MSIRETKLPSGERLPLLADTVWGIPDVWVLGFLVKIARQKDRDPTTMRHMLEGIEKGKRFLAAELQTPDVRSRAQAGPLTVAELEGLAAACARRERKGPPLANARVHYTYFLNYYQWLGKQPPRKARELDERAERRVLAAVADARPAKRWKGAGKERLGLTGDQRDLFLSVISSNDGRRNPFGKMIFRNFVLLWISYHHGLRTGELLGLKLQDLELEGDEPLLKVVVRRNDLDDPRSPPAAQKTAGRELEVDGTTVQMLNELCDWRRAVMRRARAAKHPYLFINEAGAPLGDRGLRMIFEDLRTAEPGLKGLVNHVLRHDWNDRWVELVEESGLNKVSALEAQLYAMGWKQGSPMTDLYGIRARRAAANRLLRKSMQRKIPLKPGAVQ